MEDRYRGMLLGALVGDALALGVHWIYDLDILDKRFGRVTDYLEPGIGSYHPTKKKGEFTHYGDQILLLMESLIEKGTFDPSHFSKKWAAFMETYTGYRDQASIITLQNLKNGLPFDKAGSPSNDMAGAVRAVALGYLYGEDLSSFQQVAEIQTQLTHRDPDTLICARFFARLLNRVLKGGIPIDVIKELAIKDFKDTSLSKWTEQALEAEGDVREVIVRFGQSCHTPEIFPGFVFLIKKLQGNLEEAIVEAVMSGGDNATRASAVGMVLGAYHGAKAIPERWIKGLRAIDKIERYLEGLKGFRERKGGN